MSDIRDEAARAGAHFVIDALGVSSGLLFEDKRLMRKIGHLLTLPNVFGDRRTVMDDDGIRYVICGPRTIFIGGTYIEVDLEDVPYVDLNIPAGFKDHALSALRDLRPDLSQYIRLSDLLHQVGIRPYRSAVRVRFEDVDGLPPVLHISGLGGSRWSICHGTAITAADEIAARLGAVESSPMIEPFPDHFPDRLLDQVGDEKVLDGSAEEQADPTS